MVACWSGVYHFLHFQKLSSAMPLTSPRMREERHLSYHFTCSEFFLQFKWCAFESKFGFICLITWSICSFPFDWRNPIGYFFAVVWLYISILNVLGFLACFTPLAISFLFYVISINKDWKHDIRALEKLAKGKQSDVELFRELSEFIRSHSFVKQFSES